jgi:hypothetical protein
LKSTEKKEEGGKKKLQKVHEFLIGLELSVTLHYLPLKLLFLKRYIYIYIYSIFSIQSEEDYRD